MTKNDERLPRLLALLPWLRAHPGVTVAAAAAQFGIPEPQLRADIELLWFCGLPGLGPSDLIDIEFEGETVRVLDAQTLDRPLRLTGDEGQALLAAARALRELPGLLDTGPLDAVIAKLRGAVAAGRPSEDTVTVSIAAGADDPEVMAAVRAGLADRRRLQLRYLVERRDEVTERVVSPLELRLLEGRVYLHAYDHDREATRSFRLDRVLAAALLDDPAIAQDAPDDPDAAGSGAAGSVAPGAPADDIGLFHAGADDIVVTLDLAPQARWVSDQYPAESVDDLPGGGARMVLRTPDTGWLARLVLRLGGAARVVSPASVAEEVLATARAGLAGYGATIGRVGS